MVNTLQSREAKKKKGVFLRNLLFFIFLGSLILYLAFLKGFKKSQEEVSHNFSAKELGLLRRSDSSNGVDIQQVKRSNLKIDFDSEGCHPKKPLVCPNNLDLQGPLEPVNYWCDIKGDKEWESPLTVHHPEHHQKFLVFEPDQGGWNNIRMAYECIVVAAHAMGRTLVFPPQYNMYLLMEDGERKSFEKFYSLDLLKSQEGMHMIMFEDFLKLEGLQGHLRKHGVGEVVYPPGNRTDVWRRAEWTPYINSIAASRPPWNQGTVVVFPRTPGAEKFDRNTNDDLKLSERFDNFVNGKKKIQFYTKEMQDSKVLYFDANKQRLLMHFYSFLFFEDEKHQQFYKRFVRDYLHYKEEIFCLAQRMIHYIREDSKNLSGIEDGSYDSYHIRRGDLQFKEVKIGAKEIINNTKDLLLNNGTKTFIYIATDETEDEFFKPFEEMGAHVRRFKDYLGRPGLDKINPTLEGFIESIVCARSKRFFGTYKSTFSGFITRLRGYYGPVQYGDESYYHSHGKLNEMKKGSKQGCAWVRECRFGWEDMGDDV